MTTSTTAQVSPLTGLPHWETQPDDIPAAIAEIKAAIRNRIAASGRTVEDVVAEIEDYLRGRNRGHPERQGPGRRCGRSSTTPTLRPARSAPRPWASSSGVAA